MTENEFLLEDRIAKIKATVEKYGEEKFCISYSGGKDSNVLSRLVDIALPGNKIPRVYANTGIELDAIRDFVIEAKKGDSRIHIIKPKVPIKKTLETEGYPFKSKEHSHIWGEFKNGGAELKHVQRYLGKYRRPKDTDATLKRYTCPKKLKYQFTQQYKENGLQISDMCCVRLKEEPIHSFQIEYDKPICMVGIMPDEGGRRNNAKCFAFKKNGITNFQPLVAVTKEWEDWFIEEYHVTIPALYYPPYDFYRTGCKGCPFAQHLQKELETLERFFPAERKQCEIIWKPVYDEYRRLGYRLKKPYENDHVEGQLAFTDIDMNIGTE